MGKQTSHAIATFAKILILHLPVAVSLTYMHLRIQYLSTTDALSLQSIFISTLSMLYDISIAALICYMMSLGKRTVSYVMLSVVTLLWVFSNIVYASYFHTYIPLSVISEIHSTESLNITNYIFGAFIPSDIIPLLSFAASLSMLKHKLLPSRKVMLSTYASTTLILSLYYATRQSFLPGCDILAAMPNRIIWHAGIIRGELLPMLTRDSANKQLTNDEEKAIEDYINHHNTQNSINLNADFFNNPKATERKNLIFIIAESYLACTANLTIGNKEVTPFLNKLRQLPTTIYNDSVRDNAGIGGSSDGQYIYMTGLLPLREQIAVSVLSGKDLKAFPKTMKQRGYQTAMTNPSEENMWRQKDVCPIYGIDIHKSNASKNRSFMWDNEIVDYAIKNESELNTPFCHTIITLSTHGPYNVSHPEFNTCPCYPKQKPREISTEYFNYLQQCHFMDHALEKYVSSLKSRGLYDNSLLVIASDHGWQEDASPLPKKEDATILSFLVINAPQGLEYHKGPMNQLDVFPTVMDLMNANDNEWQGLGLSIIRNNPMPNSINETTWKVSADILKGNYFAKKK